jgi:predicted DNA-binding ribbon-helix-helix protein
MHKEPNLQKIVALHPKSLENNQIFGKNIQSLSEKGQKYKLSPDSDSLEKTKRKTESITFRLESEILDSLRQEAKRKDISVNTLVSQIAKQHKNWHSTAAQAGFISVRKPLMIKLLESQNEEQVKSLAKYVADSSNKDFILMLRRKYNIHSAIDMIETWIHTSGYSYVHNLDDLDYSNRLHLFVVQHHMGMKWSMYLAELYKNLFEEFDVRNSQFDMTDSTLAFEIVVPIEGEKEEEQRKQHYLHRNMGIDYRT